MDIVKYIIIFYMTTKSPEVVSKKNYEELIRSVITGEEINCDQLEQVFKDLLDHKLGETNETSFGALFAALQTRGVSNTEIVTLFNVVQQYDRVPVTVQKQPEELYGIVGSGKDEFKTFNISTSAAIVAASMGVPVVKNGSRSDTSIAGTTDIMESLGYPVMSDNKELPNKTLNSVNFAFCDATTSFPRMVKEYVGKILFLNPLTYLLSVASGIDFKNIVFGISFDDTERVCGLLRDIGMTSALVVSGQTDEGLHFDEISSLGKTKVTELIDGVMSTYYVTPEDLGIERSSPSDVEQRKTLFDSKEVFLEVLSGKASPKVSGIVAANAGALYYINNKKKLTLQDCIAKAQEEILSGRPLGTLQSFLDLTNN